MTVERTAGPRFASGPADRVAELESELAAVRADSDQALAGLQASHAALVAANAALAAAVAGSAAAAELFAANQRLSALMTALPVGVAFSDDASCERITGNPALLKLFAVTPGDNLSASSPDPEAAGRKLRITQNGRVVPDSAMPLQRAVAENRDIPFSEVLVALPGGRTWWAEWCGAPVRDSAGAVVGGVVVAVDITERKAADAVLRADRQFFHSSIDALASTIAVLDEAGVILAVNDAWRRFADANQYAGPAYGVGRSYVGECERGAGLCTESRLVAAGLDAVLHGRQPVFELEYPCHSPAEQRWFVMRATRFQSPGPARVVVAHEDVTLRKKSEQALEDADRRKDEFLATLAHELRNPLAPLRTGLHVLKMTGTDPAAAEATRAMMERQLGQMVRLVDDLLDVSRINSGKLDLRRERVELAAVLLNAVETSRPLIDRQGHDLTVTLPPDPVPLDADPVRLAQVFSNLLNNAAKYSDPGGRIGLTADVAGGHVTVRVRDAGIGIDPGQLARVFDMFAQVQTALEKSQGGLGIGLSLVKGLVGMHGGTVEVTSAGLGRGSEFVVRLPVAAGFSAETAPAEEVPSRRPAARRVLVVDDNVDAAESLGELIAFAGHEVRTAHDGFAGVAAAAEFRPDVILLDLGMPKLNGYEAARRVRQEAWGAGVVLVALTGWGSAEDRRKTAAAGFDHHLVKPVESATILTLLAAPAAG